MNKGENVEKMSIDCSFKKPDHERLGREERRERVKCVKSRFFKDLSELHKPSGSHGHCTERILAR